jgi:hypothetical protein
MDQKSGDRDKDSFRESGGEPFQETDVPVIELTEVVEQGRKAPEKVSAAASAGEPGETDRRPERDQSFTLPREDFSGLLDDSEDEFTFTEYVEDEGHADAGESVPLDESRLEKIVARVVGDVVERVTRETVARVTEKVLTAAIEAMKDNLEKP